MSQPVFSSEHPLSLDLTQFPLPAGLEGGGRLISLRWSAGLAWVVGSDGSGKTRFLQALSGETRLPQGVVTLRTPSGITVTPDQEAWKNQVFWCDPDRDALDGLTGHAYLAHHAQRHQGWRSEVASAHLDAFQLSGHLDKPLYALSMGMRRKLRLTAAFASGAPLTLLDEPFAALDFRSIQHAQEILRECRELTTRLVVVAVSDPEFASDKCILLNLDS
jgi:ABC-type multidrug transport system ATPase subunit